MATFLFSDQTSARIETATTIGLKSKWAQIEFDKTSGKMMTLAVLSDEMGCFLNALSPPSSPFAFYLCVHSKIDRSVVDQSRRKRFRVTRYNFRPGDSPTL